MSFLSITTPPRSAKQSGLVSQQRKELPGVVKVAFSEGPGRQGSRGDRWKGCSWDIVKCLSRREPRFVLTLCILLTFCSFGIVGAKFQLLYTPSFLSSLSEFFVSGVLHILGPHSLFPCQSQMLLTFPHCSEHLQL